MADRIKFKCPHCDRLCRVPADLAGRQGRCPGCQGVLEVPSPAPAAPESAEDPGAPGPKDETGAEVEVALPAGVPKTVVAGLVLFLPAPLPGLACALYGLQKAKLLKRHLALAWTGVALNSLNLTLGVIYMLRKAFG